MIKNNAIIGFLFALSAAVLWGTVPIAVKEIVVIMSPVTLVWYRFTISFVTLFTIMAFSHQLPKKEKFKNKLTLLFITIAILGLIGNFVFFSTALKFISPTVSQVVAQMSSVGLLFASLIVFKEQLKRTQIIGVAILIVGLLLFFNTNLIEIFTQFTNYSKGVFIALLAALSWVFYGLMQKILLKQFKSQQILLILYFGCLIVLFPFSNLFEVANLNRAQLILLIYCGLNTVLGYGALVEAMNRWQVSQVSAVITLTPLFTLLFSDLLAIILPEYFSFPKLNLLAYIGAFIVVFGAMFSSTGDFFIKYYLRKKENIIEINDPSSK